MKDPKGIKMRRNAFHVHQIGKTSISASGLLLPPSSLTQIPTIIEHILNVHQFHGAVVVSVASVVEPFLIVEHREKLVQGKLQEFYPKLIHGACIDVLLEGKMICNGQPAPESNPKWLPAKLLALVDVPDSSDALLSLFGGQSSWEASWSLTPFNAYQPFTFVGFEKKVENDNEFRRGVSLEESNSPDILANSITRVSFFGILTPEMKVFEDGLHINISLHQNKGDTIMVMGSPFGVLSPFHFYNSISVGHLANSFTSGSGHSSLLMADIRCLPGMEGSPVFDQHGCLAGILTRPLRQKGSNAEIQFAVTWNAIASIKVKNLQLNLQDTQVEFNDRIVGQMGSPYAPDCRSQKCLHMRSVLSAPVNSLENLFSSVVLITMDGSWASGIVLNNNGLILTNAHILEPWRFKRTSLLRLAEKPTFCDTSIEAGKFCQWS
ncbi:hypothetical protein HPP92_025315 [Vanilla planifolia]|uniref:Glyoxysomal processing protease, glyoxysomal n=1 Tax=Vanilla planifolia TaxID=51239 RepID=A0A835UAX5_VANPL|nr:hypothetical protein HPP92_025315 [Vanilla planifolia]